MKDKGLDMKDFSSVAELRRDQAMSQKDAALTASAAVSGSRKMKGEQ